MKLNPTTTVADMLLACFILILAFNACSVIFFFMMSKKMLWIGVLMLIALYLLLSETLHYMGGNWSELKEDLFSSKREQYYWTIFSNYIGLWIMAAAQVFHIKSKSNELLRQKEEHLRIQKEIEAREMSFAFRTVQINPHFLFNVLAGIRSQTADLLPKVAHNMKNLAELLQYMLLTANEGRKRILLNKEIQQLQKYIQLEKSRFDQTCVHYSVKGLSDTHKTVPFALITIVENAFKYGVYTDQNKPISISLEISDQQFQFQCVNTIDPAKTDRPSLGIGHKNLKARLDIAFPNSYHFQATRLENDTYYVNLIIQQE